jgi:hypothetical protein
MALVAAAALVLGTAAEVENYRRWRNIDWHEWSARRAASSLDEQIEAYRSAGDERAVAAGVGMTKSLLSEADDYARMKEPYGRAWYRYPGTGG